MNFCFQAGTTLAGGWKEIDLRARMSFSLLKLETSYLLILTASYAGNYYVIYGLHIYD